MAAKGTCLVAICALSVAQWLFVGCGGRVEPAAVSESGGTGGTGGTGGSSGTTGAGGSKPKDACPGLGCAPNCGDAGIAIDQNGCPSCSCNPPSDSGSPADDAMADAQLDGGCPDGAKCDGQCCNAGQVCYSGVCCQPSCADKQCGTDSCGGVCGECSACGVPQPADCMSNGKCPDYCCPITCQNANATCGMMGDGCGAVLDCGTCLGCNGPDLSLCSTQHVCMQPCCPKTCANLGLPCGQASDGCGGLLDCGTCPPVEPHFRLVGLTFIGTELTVDIIDPDTGAGTLAASLGVAGLGCVDPIVLDLAATHVYVTASSPTGSTLFDLALDTHVVTQVQLAHPYELAGVTDNSLILGAYWTDSVEVAVDIIDPATGAGAFVGNLAGMGGWSCGAMTYDHAAHVVHAIDVDPSLGPRLYSLDLNAQTASSVVLAHGYTLGGVTATGSIVGAYWTGSAEAVDLIDPATGAGTFVGNLGDLAMWGGSITFDVTAGVAYAIGSTAAGANRVYSLDINTTLGSSAPSLPYTLARQ